MSKPSDFAFHPWDCVFHKMEAEVIASNIMAILKRTGDTWRELTWEEYSNERCKDGNFSETEHAYFDGVIGYCKSEDTARLFSKDWFNVTVDHPVHHTVQRKILWDDSGLAA